MIYNSSFYDLFVSRISIHHVYIIHEVWEKNRPQALVGCEIAREKVDAKSERQFKRIFGAYKRIFSCKNTQVDFEWLTVCL